MVIAFPLIDETGQRSCFQPFRCTSSIFEGFPQLAIAEFVVVKPVDVTVNPVGSSGPRARTARTPLTYNCRELTPVPTFAR